VSTKRALFGILLAVVFVGVAIYAYEVNQASTGIEGFLRVVLGKSKIDLRSLASSPVVIGNDTVADITRVERLSIETSNVAAPSVYHAYWRQFAVRERRDTMRFRARIREFLPTGGVVIELLPFDVDSAKPSHVGLRLHPSPRMIPVECTGVDAGRC
jgi:hypothetical protein